MNMPVVTKVQSLSESLAKKLDLGIGGQDLIDTLKETAFKGQVSDSQMAALLIIAGQYRLNPWTKEIYAYPDKQNGIVPVVGVDGWSRIINSHPQFDGMEFKYSEEMMKPAGGNADAHAWVECIIFRKDRSHPIVVREYLDEVYRAPFKGKGQNGDYLINGPWQTHTKRLHRHKSMIQCARLAFGFVGIYDEDEAERIIEKEVNPRPAQTSAKQVELISSEKVEALKNAILMAGLTETEFCAHKSIKIDCLESFPEARYEGAMNWLKSISTGENQ